jgi:very-short-patch-repair endonuclease
VISRAQLLALGYTRHAIHHRVADGRLYPMFRGVYAVGRPEVTQYGWWMGAVLACGPGAVLSLWSAAALWGIRPAAAGPIHVSTPRDRRHAGIVLHRRRLQACDTSHRHGIPVTSPICTLIDIVTGLSRDESEATINEADRLDLVDPETLRQALTPQPGRPGVARLRETLDRRTFTMTDSELERRFLPIASRAGLPLPRTQAIVNGFKVDFYWADLELVVETDGLRYHRTPAQQARGHTRDQTHAAAGLTPLRFTRAQVRYEPGHVEEVLTAVAFRLQRTHRDR